VHRVAEPERAGGIGVEATGARGAAQLRGADEVLEHGGHPRQVQHLPEDHIPAGRWLRAALARALWR
jgi:hypothetical protein